MVLAIQSERQGAAFHFIPNVLGERFVRMALSIYSEAVKEKGIIPIISRFHFFDEDGYDFFEALLDFSYEAHYTMIDESGVMGKDIEAWEDGEWEAVGEDFGNSFTHIQNLILDDIGVVWDAEKLLYINEHRTVSEIPLIENSCIQGVW